MPMRLVREGIITSERVNMLSEGAELFYRRLMSRADDYGRFEANPTLLRAALYPLRLDRITDADVKRWMAECTAPAPRPLIIVYDGGKHLQIMNFRQQTRSPSKYPEPTKDELLIKCSSNDKHADKHLHTKTESESESKAKTESNTSPYGEILKNIPSAVEPPTLDNLMVWVRAFGFTALTDMVNGSTLMEHIKADLSGTSTLKWTQYGAKNVKFAIESARDIHQRTDAPTRQAGGSPDWAKLKILEQQLDESLRRTNHPTDEDQAIRKDLRKRIKDLRDKIARE